MPPKREFTFVLRTQDEDAKSHKKKLKSVINTHVAFRAHEQRREIKRRQSKLAEASSTPSPSSETEKDQKSSNTVPEGKRPSTEELSGQLPSSSLVDANLHTNPSFETDQVPLFSATTVRSELSSLYAEHGSFEKSTHSLEEGENVETSSSNRRRSSNHALIPLGLSNQVVSWNNSIAHSPTASQLDPFIKLPMTLEPSDQALIRYWYTDAQEHVFGINAQAPFSPLRDWGFQNVQLHDIALQWVLVAAEQQLTMLKKQQWSYNLLRRRAAGYAALNDIINRSNVDLDKAYVGIIMAIMADSISLKPELLTMHVKGLDLLLHERGGIESLLHTPLAALPPFCVTMQYTYAPCEISSLKELELVKSRFLRTMRAVQKHSTRLRGMADSYNQVIDPATQKAKDTNHKDVEGDAALLRAYSQAKKEIFFSSSIGAIIWARYDETAPYSHAAGQFMILLDLGLTFIFFGAQHYVKTVFVRRLKYIAERSSAIDPNTGTNLLLPVQFASMISHVRQEVQGHFGNDAQVLKEEVRICAELIDGLKMYGYMSQKNQAALISMLRSWLFIWIDHDMIDNEADEALFTNVSAEIIQLWYRGQQMQIQDISMEVQVDHNENG